MTEYFATIPLLMYVFFLKWMTAYLACVYRIWYTWRFRIRDNWRVRINHAPATAWTVYRHFGPKNYRLFVPKTFRSQERKVPMENSRNFRSQDLSFLGTFVLGERKFPGTFVPRPFRSRELSFPGNESSWELSFLGPFVYPGTFVPIIRYRPSRRFALCA